MNTELLQSIYAAKKARRKVLSSPSIDDRVAIIEKLRDMGIALKAARGTSRVGWAVRPGRVEQVRQIPTGVHLSELGK